MKLKKIFLVLFSVTILGSCTKTLDELLVNPNGPSPSSADADLYLNQMQLSFIGLFNGASSFGMEVTRMIVMYGPTYQAAYSPVSFDGVWSTAYTGVFKHANALIPIAEGQNKFVNAGMAKMLKAYTMMTLVDMFGDIPYTDANLGIENTNPTLEDGKAVYDKALALLDEAIADFQKTSGAYPGSQDLFFGAANATGAKRWETAAKLLKLRALNTTRLADPGAKDKINALLDDADVKTSITSSAWDFEFKYSTKQANPDSRHPRYGGNYAATGSAGDYIGTHFMWALVEEKGTGAGNDPRTRYYFYRQRSNFGAVTGSTVSCSTSPPPAHFPAGMPYCLVGPAGYWGRDHGDNSGIPPDGNLRTTWGMYPAGGEFDAGQGTSVSLFRGGQGAGIQPIWQSAFTEFLKAEAALTIGTNGDPRALLESGIRKSMAKVIGFPAAIGAPAPDPALVPDAARVDAYVTKVLGLYDAAGSISDKLNVIMKEWYIALWGNGIDANNNYRRTGKPDNLQLPRLANAGSYTRSMWYPSNTVNLNKNIPQKAGVDVQIFWDTNPPGFVK